MNTAAQRTGQTAAHVYVRERKDGKPSRTIAGTAILFNRESQPLYSDDSEEVIEIIAPSAVTDELLRQSDIKMTMFHDRQLILARSRNGSGTLRYKRTNTGVSFEFEAPKTADGDKALELVRRGDISGCSFMFSTEYNNRNYVSRSETRRNGKTVAVYTVRKITGLYDFTLAADPAYPDTSVTAREREKAYETKKFFRNLESSGTGMSEKARRQIAEIRAKVKQMKKDMERAVKG